LFLEAAILKNSLGNIPSVAGGFSRLQLAKLTRCRVLLNSVIVISMKLSTIAGFKNIRPR
jgi:hypothetical protein